MTPSIVHDFKQSPAYAGFVIGTEILFVTVAIGLGMFTQVISYLTASAVYVAARLNGKGGGWRYLLQLSGSELAKTAFNIVKSSPSSINSAYSYDWNGKERSTDEQTTIHSEDEEILFKVASDVVDRPAQAGGSAQSTIQRSGSESVVTKDIPVLEQCG